MRWPQGFANNAALTVPVGLFVGLASLVFLATEWPYLTLLPPLAIFVIALLGRFPQFGYYIIVVMVPLNAWRGLLEDYPFLTISKLVGLLTIAVLLIRCIVRHEPLGRLRTSLWLPLMAFGIVTVLSCFLSVSIIHSLDEVRQMITGLLVLVLTLYFVDRERFVKVMPALLVCSTTFSALLAIMGYWFDITSLSMDVNLKGIGMRAVGAATDPNFFASMILVGIPFVAHYLFSAGTWKARGFWFLLFCHNSYAILITYSRSVTLIYMIVLCLLVIEHFRKLRIRYIGFFILAFALVMPVIAYKLPETKIFQRMASLSNPGQDTSLVRRGSYLLVAFDAVMDNPVLGSGPGTFSLLYSKSSYAFALVSDRANLQRKAHNTYVEVGVGMGLAGLLAFLLILFCSFSYLYRAQSLPETISGIPPGLIRAYGYGFFSFIISFLFLSALEHKYLWLMLGLCAACYNVVREKKEATKGEKA